jgi:hypothetical protein
MESDQPVHRITNPFRSDALANLRANDEAHVSYEGRRRGRALATYEAHRMVGDGMVEKGLSHRPWRPVDASRLGDLFLNRFTGVRAPIVAKKLMKVRRAKGRRKVDA